MFQQSENGFDENFQTAICFGAKTNSLYDGVNLNTSSLRDKVAQK